MKVKKHIIPLGSLVNYNQEGTFAIALCYKKNFTYLYIVGEIDVNDAWRIYNPGWGDIIIVGGGKK
jgi:hypothetical protein